MSRPAVTPGTGQPREDSLTAADFADASAAADRALEAAQVAHDVFAVVSLALSTEGGHLTVNSQEALWTVSQIGVEKARAARDAIDLAGGMVRTARGQA